MLLLLLHQLLHFLPAILLAASSAHAVRTEWCPRLHPIQGNDPSGPIKIDNLWHVFVTCDDGPSWGHFTSSDLVHWKRHAPTGWDSATGTVTPIDDCGTQNTSSYLALWPNTTTSFPCCDIDGGLAANASLDSWNRVGRLIARPTDLSFHQGFRDPHRPLFLGGKWRVGIGSGSGADGSTPLEGQIRWFTARDATLRSFSDSGVFFRVPTTVAGYVDADKGMVWNATWRRPLNQVECPDVFFLDGWLVVLASLQYDGPWQGTSTTWWIGRASSDGTRFVPAEGALGLTDYGQSYAARHGIGEDGRRILFAFSGWASPTLEPGCGDYHGMYHHFPRELSVRVPDGQRAAPYLHLTPAPEIAAHLRREALVENVSARGMLAVVAGAQVDVEIRCRSTTWPTSGQVAVAVLAEPSTAAAGVDDTETPLTSSSSGLIVGVDFATQRLFVDHAAMDNASLIQEAPLPRDRLPAPTTATRKMPGGAVLLRVLVDGAMIESFGGGGAVALTSFVTPPGKTPPEKRVVRTHGAVPAGLACSVGVWALAL